MGTNRNGQEESQEEKEINFLQSRNISCGIVLENKK